MTENNTQTEAAERQHHPFSPSKLQMLEVSSQWTSEKSQNTEASEAGTLQHDAAEHGIDIDDPRLSDEQAEAVALCKQYRDSLVSSLPGCTILKEVYLPIDDKTIEHGGHLWHGTTAGYVDLAIISADQTVAHIVDWKFGRWSVEPAENNLQGISYMLGLAHKFPTLKTVTVHFCMPHIGHIDLHTFTSDQFPALRLRVETVVARARAARTCTATVGSCLFCGRKATCEVLAAFALKVGKKYSPLRIPENVEPSLFTDAASSKGAMEVAQLLEAWAKSVRSNITARAIEDEAWMPDGYHLRSRSSDEMKDWKRVLAIARKAGASQKAIREAIDVSLTPLQKSVSSAAPRGLKEAAVKRFREDLIDSGAMAKKPPTYFLEREKN